MRQLGKALQSAAMIAVGLMSFSLVAHDTHAQIVSTNEAQSTSLSSVAPAPQPQANGETIQGATQAEIRKAEKQTKLKKLTPIQTLKTIDPNINVRGSVSNKYGRLGLGYRYDISPSYQSGLYTRLDRWQPNVRLNVVPGFRLEAGTEIVVVRQFDSKKKALGAKIQTKLNALPFTADNVQSLDNGSIVMFSVRAEDFKGIDLSANIAGPLNVRGRLGHADRGSFQVQAQKLSDTKVRLRLVATRQYAVEGQGDVRLKVGPIKSNIATYRESKGPESLVSTEYEFDLSNPDARNAYDSIFQKGGLTPSLRLANPIKSAESVEKSMHQSLAGVQSMATDDSSLPRGVRRVSKSYESVSTLNPHRTHGGYDLLGFAARTKSTLTASRAHLSYVDESGVRHETPSARSESRKQIRRLFGLRNEQEITRASFISESDSNGQPTGAGEYVLSLELKDKRMGKSETAKARVKLRRLIAPSILRDLGVDKILENTEYKNARIYSQVVFTKKAFEALQGLSANQLEASLKSFLTERKERAKESLGKIRKVAELLSRALDKNTSASDRLDLFGKLQEESLFRDTGSGYLMSLLPEAELEDLVSVFIRIDATVFGKDPVKLKFGQSDFSQIEKATECADYQQNRTEVDLRLEDVCATSSDTQTTPIQPQTLIAPATAAQ